MAETPGMKVTSDSSIRDLQTWQRMYENPFFNPGRRITEEDVQNALPHSSAQHSIVSGPRPGGVPKVPNSAKSRTLKKNLAHYTLATQDHFKNLPIPKRKATEANEDDENRPPPRPPNTTERSSLGSPDPEVSRPPTRQITPNPTRPLARRPRHSVVGAALVAAKLVPKPSSPAVEKPPSPAPRTPSPTPEEATPTAREGEQGEEQIGTQASSLEIWIEHSFTTVCKHDDPMDPNSYYNTHYPLLLNKVPRREKKVDSMCNLADLAVNSSEIDMSFYDQVPLRRLSSPTLSRLNTACSDTLVPAASTSLNNFPDK